VILIHVLDILPFHSNHWPQHLVTVTEVEVRPAVDNMQRLILEEFKVAAFTWLPLVYLLYKFIFKLNQAAFDRGGG
jgi:hypothetical protein